MSPVDLEQLALMVELVQDAVMVYDETARIVLANDRLLTATGHTRAELLGRPALTLVPESLREALTPRMLAHAIAPVARGFRDGLGSRIQRADGSTFEAQLANCPVSTPTGTLVMMTIREVRSLSLEEIQFRGLLEANPDATLICHPDGGVALSNLSAARLFEREHVEIFNQPLWSLFPRPYAAPLAQRLRRAHESSLAGPTTTEAHCLNAEVTRRDESVVPVEVSISGLPTDLGMTLRVQVRDISERHRLEREAEAMKDGFLATVSHELRTPLTSVLGYAELLEDLELDELSDTARSLLDVIIRNARRELRLVDDLLTMVQIGDGAFRIHSRQVNLSGLVRDAVEAALPAALQAQVGLSLDGFDEDVHIMGDGDRLGQALDNLLANSLKFSPVSGAVTVSLAADADTVTVSVANQGVGIAEAEVEHVFDRLFRGDNAVAAEKQGVGLGLSIVRSIVEAHRGVVSATSTGTTTRFEISLPRTALVVAAYSDPPSSSDTES